MRKRMLLLWTPVVLGLALLVPATTLAGSGYSVVIEDNYCNGAIANFTVSWRAANTTNANMLTIDSYELVQHSNGSWHAPLYWPTKVYKFHINGQPHSLTVSRAYEATDRPIKIGFQLIAWHRNFHGAWIKLVLIHRNSFVCYPPTS